MRNLEIRQAMKENRIFSYEVAEALGIAETTMCRKLRKELPPEEKQRILKTIERLAHGSQEVI